MGDHTIGGGGWDPASGLIYTAVAADPFFVISGRVSCVLQYKTVAANLKILCSHGDVVQILCK